MRQGQPKRMRGRSRSGGGGGGGGGGNSGGGGKGPNPLSRSYESNGPDVKIRGTAGTIADKYVQLSRDALTAGDPVGAENYMQHAEHYYRLLAAAQAQYQPHQTFVRADADDFSDLDFDAENGEQPETNGQPFANGASQNGYQQSGQPQNGYQGRSQGGGQPRDGQPTGSNGRAARGGDQNRRDRQDGPRQDSQRRDNYRQDGSRQDGNRQDGGARQDAGRNDGERQERNDRPYDRDRQNDRPSRGEDREPVGGLPAFITGGASAAPSPVAPAPDEAPRAHEPAARPADAASEVSADGQDGDPRENFTPSSRGGRRRRYGRSRGGSGADEAGDEAQEAAPATETSGD